MGRGITCFIAAGMLSVSAAMWGAFAWPSAPLTDSRQSAVILAQIPFAPKGCVHRGPDAVKQGATYHGVKCQNGNCECSYNLCGKKVQNVKCTATPG
jgi:hypothetical protein